MPRTIISAALGLAAMTGCQSGLATPVESDWQAVGGFAVGASPAYEGSSTYSAIALPYLDLEWRDTISIGLEGVKAKLFQGPRVEAGIGLSYDGGREDDGDVLFGSGGDDRLLGLGDIDGAVGLRAFASYDLEWVTVGAEVTRYLGDDNRGTVVTAGIGKRIFFSNKFFVTPRLEVAWADATYMDTFFGVTPEQSDRSGLENFDADAGIKHLSLNVAGLYRLTSEWFFLVNVEAKQMMGSAADSPVTAEDTNFSVFSVAGYRF